MQHPFIFYAIGVLATLAASYIAATADGKGSSRWAHGRIWLSPILVSVSAWALWQGQERVAQRWNSQVVFEANTDEQKNLKLRNLGHVQIEDVRIFVTVYRMKARLDERRHVVTDGIDTFSKIGGGPNGGAIARFESISPGGEQVLKLKEVGNALPFYDFDSVLGNDLHDAFQNQYCFRITFRNSISKRKHSYYLLASPLTGTKMPSLYDVGEEGPLAGGFDFRFFKYRSEIRRHQAELFDEVEDHLYRDREVR